MIYISAKEAAGTLGDFGSVCAEADIAAKNSGSKEISAFLDDSCRCKKAGGSS